MKGNHRKLAAIMFTDIVDFSGLTRRDEALALELLNAHKAMLFPIFKSYHGNVVKTLGDGFLVAFGSALQAVRCAIEVQQTLYDRRQEKDVQGIKIRIGIHLGDVEYHDGDMLGDDVNIAARIEPLAPPGGIFLSEDAARRVRYRLGVPLVALGSRTLKNIKEPIGVYQVQLPWENPVPMIGRRVMAFLRQPVVLGITAALLVLTLAGWWAWQREAMMMSSHTAEATATTQTIQALAVLPFTNMSSDEENEYFSDGLTEELINAFTRVEGLRVISRTSAFAYKNKALELREIGEKLNVDAVLEGSVRKSGETVRITAQLIRVKDDTHLWSETYDRQVEDVFLIQDEIARAIVSTIQPQFLESNTTALVTPATASPDAHNFYLQGRFYWNKRTQEGFEAAIEMFEKALEADPNYAMAYAGLADSYSLLTTYGYMEPGSAYPQAQKAALRALALDDSLAEAHTSLGLIKMDFDGDLESAEAHYKRALELNPNYATAYHWYAILLAKTNREDEAYAHIQQALTLDPLSPIINLNIGMHYEEKGLYKEAQQRFEQALELDPDYKSALWGLYDVEQKLWDQAGMEQALIRLMKTHPQDAAPLAQYAKYLMAHGKTQAALARIEQAVALSPDNVSVWEIQANLLYLARQYEDAIETAKRVLSLNSKSQSALNTLASAHVQLAQLDEAVEAYVMFLLNDGTLDLALLENLSYELNLGNLIKLSLKIQLGQDEEACGNDPYHVAILFAMEEEKQLAVQCLNKAFEAGESSLLNLVVDPIFDALLGEPEVVALLEKIGIKINKDKE